MVLEKFRKSRRVSDEDYIVALDVGTEFVKALIARLDGEELQIVGVGRARQEVSDMHSGAIADIAGVVRNCEGESEGSEEATTVGWSASVNKTLVRAL
jgi:cell division protein FtsA